jgi:hypothetical protein
MSPRKARAIRTVLDLPRLPSQMNPTQRHLYRSAKRRYNEMPAPARATFLDDVTELKAAFVANRARVQGAPNSTGVLNPSSQ